MCVLWGEDEGKIAGPGIVCLCVMELEWKRKSKSHCLMFVYIDISRLFACVHYKAVFLAFFFLHRTGRVSSLQIASRRKTRERGLKFEEAVRNTQLNLVNSIHDCCFSTKPITAGFVINSCNGCCQLIF